MPWLPSLRALALASVLLGACAGCSDADGTGAGGGQTTTSTTTGAGGQGGAGGAGCMPTTWYLDADGDGYGTPMATLVTCSQPAGYVADSSDCNDAIGSANPAGTEVCNGIDDDCDGNVDAATCPAGCAGFFNPANGHGYVLCDNGLAWDDARDACAGMGMKLARIDDAAEDAWVRQQGNSLALDDLWIGGSDSADEGTWIWVDGDQFWDGIFTGMPVGGLYSSWQPGEPNNSNGVEDCARQSSAGPWVDGACGSTRDYVCELY